MINSTTEIGRQLEVEINKGYNRREDIVRISRWAYALYYNNMRNLSARCQDILQTLGRMEDDPQFELSLEELQAWAHELITEGEKGELANPISEIKDVAQDLGESWVMCPLCQESWENHSDYAMLLCPKCNQKLHNPMLRK